MDDTAEILRILGAGQSVKISNATFPVEHKVDAILTLKTTFSLQDTSRNVKQNQPIKDADGNNVRIIKKPLVELAGEMVPTERIINVTLAKEQNNKEAKKEMGEAEKLVKNKDYRASAAAYGKIYAQYKNFAAGYSQAILTEGTEGTAAAIVLMEALVKQTNENLARTTLADMQQRNRANQRAAQQLSK
jgi:hypothetical protein